MKASLGVLDARMFMKDEPFVIWDCHTIGQGVFDNKLHFHDFYELSLIVDGSGSYAVNGVRYPAQKGLLLLTTPSDYHILSVDEGSSLRYYNVIFREGLLCDSVTSLLYTAAAPLCLELSEEEYDRFYGAIHQIFQDYTAEISEKTPPLTAKLIKNGIESLVIRMLTSLFSLPQKDPSDEDKVLRRALLYIREHYRKPITLAEVAEAADRSAGYFSGYFHDKMKLSFSEYLLNFRLLAAAPYVASTNMPMKEIAYLNGFRSLGYFSSCFKAYFGQSPREYRLHNKN